MKNITCLLLVTCMLLIQGCYNNLSIEQLNKELAELKKKKAEINAIIKGKEIIYSLIKKFDQQADEGGRDYRILGKALYLSLKGEYEDCIKTLLTNPNFNGHKSSMSGNALKRLCKDASCDFKRSYNLFRQFVEGPDKRVEYLVTGLLEAMRDKDSKALQVFNKRFKMEYINTKILPALLKNLTDHVLDPNTQENFEFLAQNIEIPEGLLDRMRVNLRNYTQTDEAMNKDGKGKVRKFAKQIIHYQKNKTLYFPISLPTTKPKPAADIGYSDYIWCTSDERKQGYYSDSEESEEDAPHFNGIYNLTKHGIFFNDNGKYSCLMDYSTTLIDNYVVTSKEDISCDKLTADAISILNVIEKSRRNHITILCVALRQNDGRIKKLVFTSDRLLYVEDEYREEVIARMKNICNQAHELNYHVIIAQQAHAEGEFVQFVQERPTRYTHIVAMGCSREHCMYCTEMLEQLLGRGILRKISTSKSSKYPFPNWFKPVALDTFCKKYGCSPSHLFEECKMSKGITVNTDGHNWGKKKNKEKLHKQLTGTEWENRFWRRTKKVGVGSSSSFDSGEEVDGHSDQEGSKPEEACNSNGEEQPSESEENESSGSTSRSEESEDKDGEKAPVKGKGKGKESSESEKGKGKGKEQEGKEGGTKRRWRSR